MAQTNCTNKLLVERTMSRYGAGPRLVNEVLYGADCRLYAVTLTELHEQEINLNAGRFANYDASIKDNMIEEHISSSTPITFGGITFRHFQQLIERQIEWCAQMTVNTSERWAISVNSIHVGEQFAHFYFSDSSTAVLFKMLWHG